MSKNERDYLSKTLLFQLLACVLLFVLVFVLKSTNSDIFKNIKNTFSERLEENLSVEEAQSVFSNFSSKIKTDEEKVTQKETE